MCLTMAESPKFCSELLLAPSGNLLPFEAWKLTPTALCCPALSCGIALLQRQIELNEDLGLRESEFKSWKKLISYFWCAGN
jgi:hypothetical protein